MSARTPRRSFAAPFVVSLVMPACHDAPPPQQPPPMQAIANPPRPTDPPAPATWTVMNQGDHCVAERNTKCPPNVPCNPPPPVPYACPVGVTSFPVEVAGSGDTCELHLPPPACPPNAICNPPRPAPVPCPK